MKILQIMAGAKHGGAETAFVDMCIALAEAGETIEVVTRPNKTRNARLKAAGITVHTLPFGGRIDVFTPWRLRKIIKEFQPHIVQSWMSRASAHVPRWEEIMGIPRYLVVSRLGGYYKLKYFKNTDYFVMITPDIGRYLAQNGVDENKLQHINNFAETETPAAPADRAAFGAPADAPLVLALGRLHKSKAHDVLIRAVADVPGMHLWIAGEGPDRKMLQALIVELQVQDRVKLLGWRNDRAALLQACDICAFVSRYEPFGTVFVQAWAQKTPVIVSEADGPRQFVKPDEDGLMVPIDDSAALSRALKRLVTEQDLREELIRNGYARYQNEFTKERCVQAYLDFYHKIRAEKWLK